MRSIFAIGLGVLVTALALEAFLQCMPVVSGLRIEQSSEQRPYSRYLPQQEYVYSHGWALANARHGKTNRQGFTNSPDFKDDAAVLVIGDSFIESLMLEYPETLQGQLNQALGGGVYAASASGNGFADALEVLRHTRAQLHPRTVVMFVEPMDMLDILAPAQRGHSMFVSEGSNIKLVHVPYVEPKAKRLLAYSALARYIYYNLKFPDWFMSQLHRSPPGAAQDTAAGAPDARRAAALEFYMTQLRALGGAGDTRIIFLVDADRNMLYAPQKAVPNWKAGDRAFFIQSAMRHGYQVVDMQPVFARHWEQQRERMDFLPVDGHWNPVAHKLAAQQILPLLPSASPGVPAPLRQVAGY